MSVVAREAVPRPPTLLRRMIAAWRGKDYNVSADYDRGWVRILESFTGAFQRNVELTINRDAVLAFHAVYACVTLIAQDIGKLRPKLVEQMVSGIWKEVRSGSPFLPVLRKPNRYQTRIKFIEYWMVSKLIAGNAYALKGRDSRGVVTRLWILDPSKVEVLVTSQGEVYYRLKTDHLRQLEAETVTVPSSEIIHDPMVTLFHPLVGVSPIFACGLAATQGVNIQNSAAVFFGNKSMPGGILTAPGHIEDDTATRLKESWEEKFGGANIGRTAVLGDGLEFKPIAINAEDSQLIEQLKWTAEMVCSCFHVPPYMIGVGPMPTYNNIEALAQAYYSQCLQSLIESFELSMDEGLGLVDVPDRTLGVELDLTGLLRMDTAGRFDAYSKGIQGGWFKPNEARAAEDMEAVVGGDTPYMQQQNYSLSELNIRREQTEAKAAASEGEPTDVQGTAMNGAQVTSLQGLLQAAADGLMPIESVRAAIGAAFPLLSDAEINSMVDPLEDFTAEPEPEPTPPPPTAPPAPAASEEPPEEEPEEEPAEEEADEKDIAAWIEEAFA